MLEFETVNMFVKFGEHVFQQSVGLPMCTHGVPLLAAEFIQKLIKQGKKNLPQKQIHFQEY